MNSVVFSQIELSRVSGGSIMERILAYALVIALASGIINLQVFAKDEENTAKTPHKKKEVDKTLDKASKAAREDARAQASAAASAAANGNADPAARNADKSVKQSYNSTKSADKASVHK